MGQTRAYSSERNRQKLYIFEWNSCLVANPSGLFLYRLRRELRHGVLPVWILETLSAGPTYGYALLVLLREKEGALGTVSPSMVYSTLARLRRFGLVRSYHGRESRGPIRRYYELTAKGQEVLPGIRELQTALRPGAGRPAGTRPRGSRSSHQAARTRA